jgi:hypothetical protein
MPAPKPLSAEAVITQAADLATVQFDRDVTAEQLRTALTHVRSMSTRKHAEDTNLIIGLAIGWASSPQPQS